jgi:hypothetical protein
VLCDVIKSLNLLVYTQQDAQHKNNLSCLLSNNARKIIFPAGLYEYETWFLTSIEHKMGVTENEILRRVFGSERKEIIGGWRKLHDEELHNLYSSPNMLVRRSSEGGNMSR